MEYLYKTKGVCSRIIKFNINENIISDIEFMGGCHGNLKAISKLLNGKTVEYIEETLSGNTCGDKSTSCADQLAKGVRCAYEETQKS